jgi:putative endonuclease
MWVYILSCSDGTYYTGVTNDLDRRISEHQSGKHEGYTSARLPIHLAYSIEIERPLDAIMIEKKIKRWSAKKKEALMKGDFELLHKLSECRNKSHYLNKK